MTITTITVDETQQAQVVFSKELNAFLRLYTIQASDLQTDLMNAQAQLATAQAAIQNLNTLIALAPVVVQPPS